MEEEKMLNKLIEIVNEEEEKEYQKEYYIEIHKSNYLFLEKLKELKEYRKGE